MEKKPFSKAQYSDRISVSSYAQSDNGHFRPSAGAIDFPQNHWELESDLVRRSNNAARVPALRRTITADHIVQRC